MMSEEGNYDFIVGFTIFMKSEYKTMHRHFSSLERAQRFANNVNIKDNHKIYVDYDLYQKEKEKNKELENADLTTIYLNGFYNGEKKWKDKIREKQIEREFELQQEYKDFEEDIERKTYKRLLEENNGNIN